MALDPKTSRHSLDNALALASASAAAYGPVSAQEHLFADAIGLPLAEKIRTVTNPSGEISATLAAFDGAIVVAFRGTANPANWLSDANIAFAPFHGLGLIHSGFRDALDSIYPMIRTTLDAWSGKGRTLFLTGHSLGGAMALLAAAYLRFPIDPTKVVPRPIAGIYTFGQPRIGNADFCQACDADFGRTLFRYVNNADIVTRVPPRITGYWHTAGVEYIDAAGAIHDDPVWWQIFIDLVPAGRQALEALRSGGIQIGLVDDHAIAAYVAAIKANL